MATTTLQQAGNRLKALREERELTQRDIVMQTHGAMTAQQISRIERGQIDKPPMQDLVLYGHLLGLSPNEVASLFGLWSPEAGEQAGDDHPRLVEARYLLRTLKEPARSVLLHWLDFAVAQARSAQASLDMAPQPHLDGDRTQEATA